MPEANVKRLRMLVTKNGENRHQHFKNVAKSFLSPTSVTNIDVALGGSHHFLVPCPVGKFGPRSLIPAQDPAAALSY